MADTKSYRISDDTHEQIKELSKSNNSMDDTFKMLLKAYDESQTKATGQNAAYLLSMKALCDGIYDSFRICLDGKTADIEQVKSQYISQVDDLRLELSQKGEELQRALEHAEKAEKDFQQIQSENNTLKDLCDALKGKNEVLEQNIELLKQKLEQATQKPARKSSSKTSGSKAE